MIRTLLRYFASHNSEQMVQKLSDSYLMRKTVASLFVRSKHIIDEAKEEKLRDLTDPKKLRSFLDQFQSNVKEEIEKAKNDLENKSKKT